MTIVRESVVIAAPIARCFALSTRVELVQRTLGMKLVDTPNSVAGGHITGGSRVVWRGWKFGLPTEHHTLITGFLEPHAVEEDLGGERVTAEAFFQDSQERGRFAAFHHDHHFYEFAQPDGSVATRLADEVTFALPFGPLGALVARFVMAPYVAKLARTRFASLKQLAEGDGWREWL